MNKRFFTKQNVIEHFDFSFLQNGERIIQQLKIFVIYFTYMTFSFLMTTLYL